MSPATIRRYFIDLDSLLVHTLNRHLLTLSTVMGTLPDGANDKHAARRSAYLSHTRTAVGGLTEAHLLLVRDRHLLPAEDLDRIEDILVNLAPMLSAEHARDVLTLLDTPGMGLADIDAVLAARSPQPATGSQKPAGPRPVFKLLPLAASRPTWQHARGVDAAQARAGP